MKVSGLPRYAWRILKLYGLLAAEKREEFRR